MRQRTTTLPATIQAKLQAFAALEDDFTASFQFVEALHGQQRFDALTVADAVHYLHACFICDCKDRLLSVSRTIPRYHGEAALHLLADWQTGDTAPVIAFLHDQLDSQPFADITRQWQIARQSPDDASMAERLLHGRFILLNRALNQLRLFEAIFALAQDDLLPAVRAACAHHGHTPAAIAAQLATLGDQMYAYIPHHALVKRNILAMNALGMATLLLPADLPGARTWRVSASAAPRTPFADTLIPAYVELTAPLHNNLLRVPFTDRPDTADDESRTHEITVVDAPAPQP